MNAATSEKCLLKITVTEEYNKKKPVGGHGDISGGLLFQFVGSSAHEALSLREHVKTHLAERLSEFRVKNNKSNREDSQAKSITATEEPTHALSREARWRVQVLAQQPDLLEMHRSLVATNANTSTSSVSGSSQITEDEFWETRKHLIQLEQAKEQQLRGISGNLVTEMKPTLTGSSTGDSSLFTGEQSASQVKYTLTPSVIRNIFVQHPSVHEAYRENVPDKLSEKEFWTQYFQSRLFHDQDRLKSVSTDVNTNILDAYILKEQVQLLKGGNIDDAVNDLNTSLEGYDNDQVESDLYFGTIKNDPKSFAMMKKLNRHSELVLRSCLGSSSTHIAGSSSINFICLDPFEIEKELQSPSFIPLNLPWEDFQEKRLAKEPHGSMKQESENLQEKNTSEVFFDFENFEKCKNLPRCSLIEMKTLVSVQDLDPQQILQESQKYIDHHESLLVFHRKVNEVLRHFWASFKLVAALQSKMNHQKRAELAHGTQGPPEVQGPDERIKDKFQRMTTLIKCLR